MNYQLSLLFTFAGLALMGFVIYYLLQIREKKKLQNIAKMRLTDEQKSFLLKTPHYKNLSQDDKQKIEKSILLFIYTKDFIGVYLDVTDEMKIIIAFYACLLLLHIPNASCYENLKTLIIYPHPVMTNKISENGGIFAKEQFAIDGQSSNDTVIIMWNDAKKEAYHLRHNNVIVHEFAHEIDFLDGEIDGVPPIEKSKYHEWTQVVFKEFNKLSEVSLKNRDWGKYKILGSYAATNEAEFFAVISERFFESPKSLKKHFPELYKELADFYKIDTQKLLDS